MLVECCLKLVSNRFDVAFSLKWLRLDSVAFLSFQSGCGSSVAQFGLFEVAVARAWRISVFPNRLWLGSGAFLS